MVKHNFYLILIDMAIFYHIPMNTSVMDACMHQHTLLYEAI